MAVKSKAEKDAEALAAEEARRAALTDEERAAEDKEKADKEAAYKAVADAKKTKKTVVSVQFNEGVREFSKEIHGDDFEDLANEFAKNNSGTII